MTQKPAGRNRTITVVHEPTIVHAGHRIKGCCKCAPEVLEAAYARPAPEGDFHKLFYECHECKKRPAARLCTTTWKGMCLKHSDGHPHPLSISYDLSVFDTMLFCNKCKGHAMCESLEPVLEHLFTTKGSFVDEAIADKDISTLENDRFGVVACTMQGWRSNNEDAYCVHMNLGKQGLAVFGVFDGHGGDRVAQFVATNFAQIFTICLKNDADLSVALRKTFIAIDEAIMYDTDLEDFRGGCGTTACVVVIDATHIYCANAGDARAILSRGGATLALSSDHKPLCPLERARIEASGSRVSKDGRVDDVLAVARALGDHDFKQAAELPPDQQAVTCVPDVSVTARAPGEDEFVVIACDGIWDCKTSDEVGTFIRQGRDAMKDTAASLLDACLSPTLDESGIGTDNMSIVCVSFKK